MEVKVNLKDDVKKEVRLKERLINDILIPSIKVGLFTFLYSVLTALMFGQPLSTDDICPKSNYERNRRRRSYSPYSDYYRRRNYNDFR